MSRNPRLYLEDIQQSCAKVLRFTAGLSIEQFKQDDRTYDAVLRNLEIIGEAAKNVPDEIRQRFSFVKGAKLAAFEISPHISISALAIALPGISFRTKFQS